MSSSSLLDGLQRRSLGKQSFFSPQDPLIIGWLREAIAEGEQILKEDPGYDRIDQAMGFVMGEQLERDRPSYLPQVVVNLTKKSMRSHVSALTDLRPIFSYRSSNPAFTPQSELLNQLVILWWVNSFADLELGDAIKYSLAAGSGDMLVEYDQSFLLGDNRFIPRDPRDTLPIRPSRDRSLQSWEGVIIREARTLNYLLRRYPDKAHLFHGHGTGGKAAGVFTRFRRVLESIKGSPAKGMIATWDEKAKGGYRKAGVVPEITLYRIYLTDSSRNMTREIQIMGDPTASYSYAVSPGELLYPHKRLILWSEDAEEVIYDGPSPYWHGMYPICRLKLDPWPWSFLGLGLVHDAMPLQKLINSTFNDFAQVFSQWVNRVQVADKNAIPEQWFKRFDPRKPNQKVRINPGMGEGFKMLDGPQTPPWAMLWLQFMFQQFDSLTGTANLQALLQARQLPSGDTIQKYFEALTPEIRSEGRMIETFLREAAHMLMVNIFQFYDAPRRIMLLGDAGVTKADLDFDPGSLVPAMIQGQDNYVPELDSSQSHSSRAKFFHKLFSFYVAPNSMLAVNAVESKMMHVQLARMGMVDYWTLLEKLEVPNVGEPPPVPIPDFEAPPQPMMTDLGIPALGPDGAPVMQPQVQVRKPVTITERLIAQQVLGIGMSVSPVGRKSSGQEPPTMKDKGDGSQTITESK